MNPLQLKGAIYSPYRYSIRNYSNTVKDCWNETALCLMEHHNMLRSNLSFCDNYMHVICSTINSTSLTSGQITWKEVKDILKNRLTCLPIAYIDSYECASWGYALRYFLSKYKNENGSIVISIIDVDFNDFSMWINNPPWGRSGFGITTIALEKSSQIHNVIVGCARGLSPITEFGMAVRRHANLNPDYIVAVPFFENSARHILNQIICNCSKLEDLHAQWGHCFGSDPWISSITEINNKPERNHIIATSYALNGYYAIVNIEVKNKSVLKIYTRN